jgi:hypothetical protein
MSVGDKEMVQYGIKESRERVGVREQRVKREEA